MARPTDPAKLAAYLARQARNSANYRARQAAALRGTQVPAHAVQQRPAHYRPPRVQGVVERAQAAVHQQRLTRAGVIESLPDIRNPKVRLRAKEITDRGLPERKTRRGQQTQAERFRQRERADRLQAIGKGRKAQLITELYDGPQSERLQENMMPEQRHQFQRLMERITRGSQQSIAILFEYAGGASDYAAALDRILGSPESRDVDEGLSILETLADRAAQAAVEYAPSKIGRLTV